MKKLLIAFILLSSFTTQQEKTYDIKFSEASLNYHWQNLNNVKTLVGKSNMPHQEVVYILQSIDSLQSEIGKQVKTEK